jgi:hypothetical protein
MGKSRTLAILMPGLACLFLIACHTVGTPKQSDGTPTKSRATAGPQALPLADSVSQNRTASYSGDVRPVTSTQLKDRTREAVGRLGNLSSAVLGPKIRTMRAIIYATVAVIFVVVIGAITAERVGRHRKLTPSSLNARH